MDPYISSISIKGSILEINHPYIYIGDGVMMAGYSVIAVWIREVVDD
jgi:hypothetical protein